MTHNRTKTGRPRYAMAELAVIYLLVLAGEPDEMQS